MFEFPTSPVAPDIFFEKVVPSLFAELELNDFERAIDLTVGIVLTAGDADDDPPTSPSGAWTLRCSGGELAVASLRAADCDLTIVQSVSDWRSALWEGRPALVADAVATVRKSGPRALEDRRSSNAQGGDAGPPPAWKGLADIRGLIELRISDDADDVDDVDDATSAESAEGAGASRGAAPAEDWKVGVLIGPGEIPEEPQACIRLGASQAEAMRRGELHPVEALISGELRLEGDLGLILQLQAVAMMAAAPPPSRT